MSPEARDSSHRWVVFAFAAFVALLILSAAYLTSRDCDLDELGLYNPSYMVARHGTLTYPAHGYFEEPVIVHPPFHVGLIGLLMRAGLSWYYAEATPAVCFFLLAIVLAARLPAPVTVRLSFLFALGFLALGSQYLAHKPPWWGMLFGTRPEGEVLTAWISGLLLLEGARLRQWSTWRLFCGGLLLAWAAGVHYYGWPALLGILVYAIILGIDLGWKRAIPKTAVLFGGACLFGIPYLTLYLIPNWNSVLHAIRNNSNSLGGIAASLSGHRQWYRTFAPMPRVPVPLRAGFTMGIPLLVFSTAVMCSSRWTRSVALAALPFLLAVFALTPHKMVNYLTPEIFFFMTALCLTFLAAVGWLSSRLKTPVAQHGFPAAAAILLGGYLLGSNDLVQGVLASEGGLHEGEIARAAAKTMLGPNAKVASRVGLWYISGAAHWHHAYSDLLFFPASYDPLRYFANFDAVADHIHGSDWAADGESTLSALYVRDTLKLRGFYFGETSPELQFVLLNPQRPSRIGGYTMRHGQLYRFEEHPAGDHEVTLSMCSSGPKDAYEQLRSFTSSFAILRLPHQTQNGFPLLVHVLAPLGAAPPAAWIGNCTRLNSIRGTLVAADKTALVAALRRDDPPIDFVYGLEDLPGYRETGVPARLAPPNDCVRLDHVIDLSKTFADSTRAVRQPSQILVTTLPGMGAFSASIPFVHGDAVDLPCWIQLRLRVTNGRIGFLTRNSKSGEARQAGAYLGKTGQPVEIAFPLPSLKDIIDVIVFNANMERTSQVEILDSTVLVNRADWERNKAALETVR